MAETTRWGLEKKGGPYGGAITDDGGKYTTTDRDLIDRLLAFFETHKHDGGASPVALASPTLLAVATQHSTGGTIARGTTRFYKFTLVDQFGFETVGSPEVTVTLPSTIAVTVAPVVTGSTAGGSTLAEGAYYYALTGNTVDGETILGPEAVLTVQTGQNQANITLPALPSGVDSWNVWRMGVTEQGWTKVFDSQAPGDLVDVGYASGDCLCDPTTQPPTVDLVASGSYSITITPDPADLASATSWRLYESDTSGSYGSASLVAAVVPVVVGDPPPASYLDTGTALLAGQPPLVSNTIKPSHAVSGGGGGGGADSRWISDTVDQHLPTVVGDSHPVYIEGATLDTFGFDIVAVYEPSGDSAGDELQIDTDAVYSFFGRLIVNGAHAGDQFQLSITWDAGGPTLFPMVLGTVVIPPGQTSGETSWLLPPMFVEKGSRASFAVASFYSTTAPDEILASIGAAMASGTAADAEVYPAPADLATTIHGAGDIDVTWTTRVSDLAYHVLCYDRSGAALPPVAKNVETTGTSTFSGLVVGHQYDIVLLARKTLAGTDMFSTAAPIASVNLSPTASFFFSDNFNRADSLLGLPDWAVGQGDPAGVMAVEANALSNTGTGAVAYALRPTARASKRLLFTHIAPSSGVPVVADLASSYVLGNPRCLVTVDPTAGTAPTVDYYDGSGTHTAIVMTAVGSGMPAYDGSSATMTFTIHGDQVMLYHGSTLVAVAVLPAVPNEAWSGVGLQPNATGGTIDDLEMASYQSVASSGPGGSQQFSAGGVTYAAELLPVDDATAGRLGVVALYGKQTAPTLDGFTRLFEQHDGTGYLSLWWKIFDGSEAGGLQVYAQAAPFVGAMKSYTGMTTATGTGGSGATTPTATVAIGDVIVSAVASVSTSTDNGFGSADQNAGSGGENDVGSTDGHLVLMLVDEDSAIAGTSEARTGSSGGTSPTYSAGTVVLAP